MDIMDDLPWGETLHLRIDKAGQESVCRLVKDERDELANRPTITREQAMVLLGLIK